MTWRQGLRRPGVAITLLAALLFGGGTPAAKWLLGGIDPVSLAGLLYLGSGLGLAAYLAVRRIPRARPRHAEWLWLAGAIALGGIVAPVLLMLGLSGIPAASAALLLNAEGILTALLAWVAFKENFDRRVALGMFSIAAGAACLAWPDRPDFPSLWPALAVLCACLGWAMDNNLTRKLALADPIWIAAAKGLAAGSVNLALGRASGATPPPPALALAAMAVGLFTYGVSLALFILGLRHLGAARTGAYFSIAPFFGAALAVALFGEPVTPRLLAAGLLMALGTWLHLTERHSHEHFHEEIEHEHEHAHDEHHQHEHEKPVPPDSKHTHRHRHAPLLHEHPHFPDAHHRHDH